jgi:molecular chaperone GrpE
VLDNLERAMVSAGSVEDLKAGIEMIVRQLREVLRQHDIEEVEALGKPFDPALHEAVAREEDPGAAVPTVTEELQCGYTIQGRLLRPAMVRVAMPREHTDD